MIFVKLDTEKIHTKDRTFASFDKFSDANDPEFTVRQGRLLEGRELWVYEEIFGYVGRGQLEFLAWEDQIACIRVYPQTIILDVHYCLDYDYSSNPDSFDKH